jgi:hypothetical protein
MNTKIDFKNVLNIIKTINDVGLSQKSKKGVLCDIKIFKNIIKRGYIDEKKLVSMDEWGCRYDEILTRFLYLSCVLDQGPEIQGVEALIKSMTNKLYPNIKFLHDPLEFFEKINIIADLFSKIIPKIHADGRRRTRISAYSVLDQKRICPTLTFRWGTPLLVIKKLMDNKLTLLGWIKSWNYADEIVARIKYDQIYGLGDAIGDKASRLFMKLLIHGCSIIKSGDPGWDNNSYQIPIDSNIGRILMRTGLVFYFMSEREFVTTCCRPQNDKRINLGSNRLRNISISSDHPNFKEGINFIRKWNSRLRSIKFPAMLNVLVDSLKKEKIKSGIGILDDGMMHIGTTFCSNNVKEMNCSKCPLRDICMANIQEKKLKTTFYCGTGEGVFY